MPEQSISADIARTCMRCDRVGTRGFVPAPKSGQWVCASSAACERRIRGTGMVGVGVMRNYVR